MSRLFRKKNKKGIVLILAFLIIVPLVILAGSAAHRAINEFNLVKRNRFSIEALYLAEGGVDQIAYLFAYNTANNISDADNNIITTSGPESIPNLPSGFLPADFSLNYECVLEQAEFTDVDALGITTFVTIYKITVYAWRGTELSATVNQFFARKKTYTFQHAVFYVDDLEILPGPNMTLSGKIHSNSDIYIGANNTLTIDTDYLYTAGDIYNRRKNNGTRPSGDVAIEIKGSPGTYANMEIAGAYLDSDDSDWTTDSQTRWNGTVKSSVHGVTALAAPEVSSIQPGGYYAGEAGLKITKKIDGSWEIFSGATQINMSDLPADTIIESTFLDNRENINVTVTDIDISKLNSSGYFPSNGLLYATREDASSSQPNGIRLIEGGALTSNLTVVSNDPVYILGNYNNDVNKKSAAIISDAVNILSNSWDDTNNNFSDRNASVTEINAAFIAGNVPTPDGANPYSGGLENYPRLHENWQFGGTKELIIRGSFVELWESQIAKGSWSYGDPNYKAPIRNWDYDTDFNNSSNLPPFTPFAVEMERVAWWKN